jgi:nucleoside-diphosphate-sugar epimerase
MALSVLYIGGSGQISLPCVEASVAAGHRVTLLNRGKTSVPLPKGVATLVGDMHGATYDGLADQHFDVVCQFRLFAPEQMQRDIATFTGKTGQYVFVSSASAYQKPARHYLITEKTPLENPHWQYSRDKIASEGLLRAQTKLQYTIVRPSHTVRTGTPIQIGDDDVVLRRMIAGRPTIVAGDGTSLWTLTRAVDFAQPFVGLLGNNRALNDDFHITGDRGFTWDQIHQAIARGFGVEANIVHVPTDTLIRYNADWIGPLLGDKTWSALFDNSKVKGVAGDFTCAENLDEILAESIKHAKKRLAATAVENETDDALIERIVREQGRLGK